MCFWTRWATAGWLQEPTVAAICRQAVAGPPQRPHLDQDALLLVGEGPLTIGLNGGVQVGTPPARKRVRGRGSDASGGLRAARCQLPLMLSDSAQAPPEAIAAHLRLQDLALRLGYRPGACATTVHLLVPCLATSRMSISSSCSSEWLWVRRGQSALRGYRVPSGAAQSTCQAPWQGRWRCPGCSRSYTELP